MSLKTLILAGAATVALAATPLSPAFSAAYNSNSNATTTKTAQTDTKSENRSAVGRAASSVGNAASSAAEKAEHAVGINSNKDAFSKEELKSAVALNKLDMPEQKLSNAKIEDRAGESIGDVHDIVMGKNGKPSALHVDVGGFLGIGGKMVSIPASRLSWLPDKNMLVTNMTKNQIKSLKEVKTSNSNEKGKATNKSG